MYRKVYRDAKSGRYLLVSGATKRRRAATIEPLKKDLGQPLDLPEPDLTDPDNPEWTEEDFKRARPASELPEEVLRAFPATRGRPKKPDAKIAVSIRLDLEIVDAFKAEGPGWQTRINDVLRKSIKGRQKVD